jgi:hypothetical protein
MPPLFQIFKAYLVHKRNRVTRLVCLREITRETSLFQVNWKSLRKFHLPSTSLEKVKKDWLYPTNLRKICNFPSSHNLKFWVGVWLSPKQIILFFWKLEANLMIYHVRNLFLIFRHWIRKALITTNNWFYKRRKEVT